VEVTNPIRVKYFWEKVNKDGPIPKKHPELGKCWEWTGAKDKKGYGNFTVAKGKTSKAHRFSFKLAFGWLLDHPYQVHHKCENTSCVRPKHLIHLHGTRNNDLSTSPSAINKRKTHCKRGHEFTEDNIVRGSKGNRRCKSCREGDL
jgi:hypothetical protein